MNTQIDETHDPKRVSWLPSAKDHSDFPIQNLPLGIFTPSGASRPRPGVAIGESVLDLKAAAEAKLLVGALLPALSDTTLNPLFALDPQHRLALRRRLSLLLSDPVHKSDVGSLLYERQACTFHLPAAIGDYTDFYVGIHHAENVGRLFRPDNPLLPNYKYVPIGYHGRASSVRLSGLPVVRPNGQRKLPNAEIPSFGPSQRLDYELELGVWIGEGNTLGQPIKISDAERHIAGFCLLNDWSARDIQAWEYQPLGPFLAKNFHTTISPWVVTVEALVPFRVAQPARPQDDPQPLSYLWDETDQQRGALGLDLAVSLWTAEMRKNGLPAHRLSLGRATHMYWTVAQIIAHHTSNGCDLRPGDLLGTGTISGITKDTFGSLLEISGGGKEPLILPNGETRTFLEDSDEVILSACAHAEGYVPIGFGECRGIVTTPHE